MGRALIPVTRGFLHEALALPDGTKIHAIHADPETGGLIVTVDDLRIFPHPDGCPYERIVPKRSRALVWPWDEEAA